MFQKCNCQKLQSLRSVPLRGPFNILQNVEGLQLLLETESSKFSEVLFRKSTVPVVSCSPSGLPEAEPLERHENPHHDVLLLGLPSWPVLRKSIQHTALVINPSTVMTLERGTRPKSKETHLGVRSCSVLNFHKRDNGEMTGRGFRETGSFPQNCTWTN